MPAQVLTPTAITRAGVVLPVAAATETTLYWANAAENHLLIVENGGVGSLSVTIDIPKTIDGQTVTDRVVTVGAGVTKLIGPFPRSTYNDANGRVNVTLGQTTDVNIGVITF